MNWKEFLKPSFWKLILFLFLNVLAYFVIWTNTVVCLAIGCPSQSEAAFNNFILLSWIILPVTYLISCALIWIFRSKK